MGTKESLCASERPRLARACRAERPVLAVMLAAAGLELATVGEGLNSERAADAVDGAGHFTETVARERWLVMMVTLGGFLALRNAAVGFIAGAASLILLKLQSWADRRVTGERQGPLSTQ